MASTLAKRRKTSPSTHVAVNGEDALTRLTSQDGEPGPTKRASFMSPTKASLMRFNPTLVSPFNASEMRRPRSQGSESEKHQLRSGVHGHTHHSLATALAGPSAVLDRKIARPNLGANEQGLRATPLHRSRTPSNGFAPTHNTRPIAVEDPQASPLDKSREESQRVRAKPLEEQSIIVQASDTGNHVASTNGPSSRSQSSRLPSSPTHLGGPAKASHMSYSEDGEPSLPYTPAHLKIEYPSAPPQGLLSNSPSRRAKRKDKTAAKTSPFIPRNNPPGRPSSMAKSLHPSLGTRIYISTMPQPPCTAQEADRLSMRRTLAGLERQLQDIQDTLIRQTLVSTWKDEGSKSMKDFPKNKKEILSKSAKVLCARDELVGINTTRSSGLGHANVDAASQMTVYGTKLPKSTLEHSPTRLAQSPLIQRLTHFLPFSEHSLSSTPNPTSKDEIVEDKDTGSREDGTTVPFCVKIANVSLLPHAPDKVLRQRQTLILSSPLQLLRAELLAIINVGDQRVEQLQVLEISPWADKELGSWLRGLTTNVHLASVGRAFGRYHEISKERAQCFKDCEGDLKALLHSNDTENPGLRSYLGQQALTLSLNQVALDISWSVSITHDGEVQSAASAKADFPTTWRRGSGGAELDRVGEAFDLLVKNRGAVEAIHVICNLIFPG